MARVWDAMGRRRRAKNWLRWRASARISPAAGYVRRYWTRRRSPRRSRIYVPACREVFFNPTTASIYAPAAASWLIRRSGAELRTGVRVSDVRAGSVHSGRRRRTLAGIIVIAAGERTPGLLRGIPVRPRKGHLAITDRYPGFLRHQVVELGYVRSAAGESTESVACNVQPRPTGQLLIGSSRQYGVDTSDVHPALLARMLRRCIDYLPKLAELSVIRTWTGFRASTPDKLPIIGPYPQLDRVWLATGHEGLGITMAPGTARILADQILGRTPAHSGGAISARAFCGGRASCMNPSAVSVNGQMLTVGVGTSVAAAILIAGVYREPRFRVNRGLRCAGWARASSAGRRWTAFHTSARARPYAAKEWKCAPVSDAYDVVVVGAGPAGMTAAMTAARHGLGVLLLDDNPAAGGQIWRGEQNTAIKSVESVPRSFGTRAVGLARPGVLLAEQNGFPLELPFRKLVLATGARERFLPFPGWTLPGVFGAGGLQAS